MEIVGLSSRTMTHGTLRQMSNCVGFSENPGTQFFLCVDDKTLMRGTAAAEDCTRAKVESDRRTETYANSRRKRDIVAFYSWTEEFGAAGDGGGV